MYCSRCKTTKGQFIKQASYKGRQYYWCRPCNRERLAAYRATKTGKLNVYKASRKSVKKHPERQNARYALYRAVKSGKIQKPNTCSQCGKRFAKRLIQGHHEDYSRPLDVVWLDAGCHADIEHVERRKR